MKWILLGFGILLMAVLIFSIIRGVSVIVNFFLRVVYGFLAIYLANWGLSCLGIHMFVGYNPVSLLTLGALGISGFIVLYGIMLGKFL